jgi:hypothetical protein
MKSTDYEGTHAIVVSLLLLVSRSSIYLPQQLVIKHPDVWSFLRVRDPSFTHIKRTGKMTALNVLISTHFDCRQEDERAELNNSGHWLHCMCSEIAGRDCFIVLLSYLKIDTYAVHNIVSCAYRLVS